MKHRINVYINDKNLLAEFDSYCKAIGSNRSAEIHKFMVNTTNYTAPVKPEPLPEWMQ